MVAEEGRGPAVHRPGLAALSFDLGELLLLVRGAGQRLLDEFGHIDDVGTGLAVDRNLNGLGLSDARDDLAFLVAPGDLGNVANAYRVPAPFDDRKVGDLLDVLELVARAHEVFRGALQ